jgi:hypothetical protein
MRLGEPLSLIVTLSNEQHGLISETVWFKNLRGLSNQ